MQRCFKTTMKRIFIKIFIISIFLSPVAFLSATETKTEPDRVEPLVGAIRWDAWYGKVPEGTVLRDPKTYPGAAADLTASPDPGADTRWSLSYPKVWEWRTPFYAEFDDDGRIADINGNRTEILEREIELARSAGLDYWAFTIYPEDCPLSWTLKTFLKCPGREKIKFCLFLLSRSNYGSFVDDPEMQEYALRLLSESNYLKVSGNRPVIYLGFLSDNLVEKLRSGVWKDFCDKIEVKGLGRPYVVACNGNPAKAADFAKILPADAVSNYVAGVDFNAEGAPYRELAGNAERFWDDCKAGGVQVAPICMAGWDRRPRFLRPVSWEQWHQKGEFYERCYLPGTPEQVAEHIGRSCDWLKKNPNRDGVHLSLIYAWNEYDEGGWIAPTLPPPRGDGNARLEALKKVLEEKRTTR